MFWLSRYKKTDKHIRCRTGIASGAPIPIDLMKQLIAKLNLKELTVAYGMSERPFLT